jgi:hypothetical protein
LSTWTLSAEACSWLSLKLSGFEFSFGRDLHRRQQRLHLPRPDLQLDWEKIGGFKVVKSLWVYLN